MNEPQEEIKQIILQILKNDFPDSSDEEIQFYYDDFLNIYNIRNEDFYINELNAYEKEMKIFPNDVVSDSYKNERQLATWEYEEKLNIIRNNKK